MNALTPPHPSDSTPGLIAQQKGERRGRIRAAARRLLSEFGYEGLTVRKLAAACGLSVPTLYNLVGSKATIIAEDAIDSFTEASVRFESLEAGDTIDQIFALMGVMRDAVLDRADYYRALLPHVDAVPELREVRKMVAGLQIGRLLGLMAAAPPGLFRPDVDLQQLAIELFESAMGTYIGWAVDRVPTAQLEARLNHGASLLLGGAGPRGGGAETRSRSPRRPDPSQADTEAPVMPPATARAASDVPRMAGHLPFVGHAVRLFRNLPALLRSLTEDGAKLQHLRAPGGLDMLVWGDPASFDLFKHKASSSAHQVEAGEVVFGNTSMISSDGAEHRHRRNASGHPFTPRGLTMSGVSAVISEVVQERVADMLARPDTLLLEESQVLAIDIMFRVMGVPRDELRPWTQKYTAMQGAVGYPKWSIPGTPYHRARQARAWVDERLIGYVERARKDPEMTGLVAELVRGRDEEGNVLSDQEILDNLRLMAFAGHETTASTIAWVASYAATRPEVHDRLMEEALAGASLPQTPKEMGSYPYAEAMFREVLRLHPPVPLSSRLLSEDMVIEGYHLPAGTIVGIPIWLFGRDASLYPDPERFLPDRWLGENRRRTPIETSAFGGGPHFCLGYHMAWVEVVQFTVALMRGLHAAGVRLSMPALPGESYIPLLRPKMNDTRCTFRPAS